MRLSFISLSLASAAAVIAGPLSPRADVAPALPPSAFNTTHNAPLTLDDAKKKQLIVPGSTKVSSDDSFRVKALCSNPSYRREWHSSSLTDAQRQNFVDAIKCLMKAPSKVPGSTAKNRYEDLVRLHQKFTPTVHGNRLFLVWHRYYLWTFEDILRKECKFTAPLPWFDETKYSGRFSQSSIFSKKWFGSIAIQGRCVTDGQFANTVLNIGPGTGATRHCLSRNGDGEKTKNTNAAMVKACNDRDGFANMAACAEGGAHAWGHNGIGSVMADVYASVGDPTFWLHHAFIDRNFRVWQNQKASRRTSIDGQGPNGALTMDTVVSMDGIRPNVRIRDLMDTFEQGLCYRYDY
ncbi:Di-copper centre-containing protein [Naviculisporaceae sp. PSN 640]